MKCRQAMANAMPPPSQPPPLLYSGRRRFEGQQQQQRHSNEQLRVLTDVPSPRERTTRSRPPQRTARGSVVCGYSVVSFLAMEFGFDELEAWRRLRQEGMILPDAFDEEESFESRAVTLGPPPPSFIGSPGRSYSTNSSEPRPSDASLVVHVGHDGRAGEGAGRASTGGELHHFKEVWGAGLAAGTVSLPLVKSDAYSESSKSVGAVECWEDQARLMSERVRARLELGPKMGTYSDLSKYS